MTNGTPDHTRLLAQSRGGLETTFRAERDSISATSTLVVATMLFAAIFALNFQTTSVGQGIALFYTLPIAVLALRFGINGGLIAATVASGLFVVWTRTHAIDAPALAYATRLLTFYALGGGIGRLGGLLAANEARFATALGNASVAVFNMDRDLRYTWFRQSWPDRLGYSLVGLTDADLLSARDEAPVTDFKRHVIESGEPGVLEACMLDLDTQPRWFTITAEPMRDTTGRVHGLTATALEITDRKMAERALSESERRFRTAVENLLEPFAVLAAIRDDRGVITNFRVEFANTAAAELAGRHSDAMIGRTFAELFPGRLESRLFDEYVKVVESGEPYFREAVDYINVLGEDTLVRAFDMRVSKLDDGVEVTWRDITDLVRARQARDWLASIVESSADAIVSVRTDGTIESWSAGATRMYGYKPEEVIGKHYTVLFSESVANERSVRFQRVLAGESVGPVEDVELRKDGSEVHVTYTGSPIRDDNGKVIGAARIIRETSSSRSADRTAEAGAV